MKIWICSAITLACMSVGAAALACPTGGDGVRPPRPVVQPVSLQASEMVARASRLEKVAASHDAQARALEQQAATLLRRARLLRNEAGLVNVSDRSSLLAVAEDLASRAASDRAEAADDRAQASELRVEARALRQRATALVGRRGGSGWRKRIQSPVPRPTTLPSERGVTTL